MRYGNGMNANDTDIYLIAAHPAWRESRVNRPLMRAAQAIPRVQVQDLYSSYPDYSIDIAAEQRFVEKARLVVLLHPIQWYSMPALQKLWFDEVLTYGWAYGEKACRLQGKDLWLVDTTGGPESSYQPQGYNRYAFDAFLPPYEQTAALCGMRFLPPLMLHGAHVVGEDQVSQHIARFGQRLQSYPNWPEVDQCMPSASVVVPSKDRPAEKGEA